MALILKRMAMALLVSFGGIAAWAPFHFHQIEGAERQVVDLCFLGYVDAADSPVPGLASAPRVSEEEMEEFPAIRDALVGALPLPKDDHSTEISYEAIRAAALNEAIRSTRSAGFLRVDQEFADAFARKCSKETPSRINCVYRGHLFRIEYLEGDIRQTLSELGYGDSGKRSFGPVMLRYDSPIQVFPAGSEFAIADAALENWPKIKSALQEEIQERRGIHTDQDPITASDWTAMIRSFGNEANAPMRIVYQGRILEAEERMDYYQKQTAIAVTPLLLRILGAIAIILGLVAGRGLYRPSSALGIPVSSPPVTVALDAILVIFLALCWFPTTDFLLNRLFAAEAIVAEAEFYFMGVFCGLFAVVILGIYITTLSVQRVLINAEGIRVSSIMSHVAIAWDELLVIETSDFYVPVGRIGTVMPKRVARVLKLEGDRGSATILEPSTRAIKNRIVNAMLEHAPEALCERIREAGRSWTV
jgi:hypothetical protein